VRWCSAAPGVGWHDDAFLPPDRVIGTGRESMVYQTDAPVQSQFKKRCWCIAEPFMQNRRANTVGRWQGKFYSCAACGLARSGVRKSMNLHGTKACVKRKYKDKAPTDSNHTLGRPNLRG
jgi:hypothetical protein